MSKTTFTLDELRARAAERRGGDTLTITAGGKPFTIPAPGFWSDQVKDLARQARTHGDLPFVRALMGAKKYEEFVKAGGRADDIGLLIDEYRRAQGVDGLGESSPSPTS